MHILIVEDDEEIAAHIRAGLKGQGHDAMMAGDGHEGLKIAETGNFDLIVLDRMLPSLDGIELLAALRKSGVDAPVLMLTARGSIEDRVTGLSAGADDYLVKPFAIAELLARVEALGRRSRQPDNGGISVAGSIRLNRMSRQVTRAGRDIPLHPREFEILDMLMRHFGRPVPRSMLLKAIWRFDFDPGTKVVESHLSRLRAKLDAGFAVNAIETVRGEGYRIRGDA
ncbi:MAG: response regulator transcription factor [Sphingobium sp.]